MKIPTHNFRVPAACWPLALVTLISVVPVTATAQSLAPWFGNAAGRISQVAIAQVAQDEFVTAMINGSGDLEIISWFMDINTQQLERLGTWYGAPASAVSISAPYSLNGVSEVFTTAAINANGNLDIGYWELGGSGEVGLASEVQGGQASLVSVASVYNNQSNGAPQFMTAIRNITGSLEVSLWYVDTNSKIHLSGSALAGGIKAVSIACLIDQTSDVVTAVENNQGDLEIIQWYYARFGTAVTRGNTVYTSTPANAVSVTPGANYLDDPPYLVNAFYTAGANPSTNQINVSAWNQDMGLQASAAGVSSNQMALASRNTTAFMVSTPSSGGDYTLSVFDKNGSNEFGELTSAFGQYASNSSIAVVDTNSTNDTILAVAYRNSLGNLQIQLWYYTPACAPYCQ